MYKKTSNGERLSGVELNDVFGTDKKELKKLMEKYYRRFAGEWEARRVEVRSSMGQERLDKNPFEKYSSYDPFVKSEKDLLSFGAEKPE